MPALHVGPGDRAASLPESEGWPKARPAWRQRWEYVWRELANWIFPHIVAPYVVTRVAILVVAQVASISIDHLTEHGPVPPTPGTSWFDPLLLFDARWYMDIAAGWYQYDPQAGSGQTSVVFFPLYPLLIRGVDAVFGGGADSLPAIALVIANVFALLGLALVYRLALRELGASVAQRTVWYVLAFPVSFYLSSAYAEPVFLAACVGAIYAARTQHWYVASLAGVAAALSRPYGVLIVAPLTLEYLRQNWGSLRRLLQPHGATLLLPVLALGMWMGYLYSLTGDPLVFVHAQSAWNQQDITSPLKTLLVGYGRTRDQQLHGIVDSGGLQFGIAVVAVAATLLSWRALPPAYALFATLSCVVVLSSGSTMSIWRHAYLIFPLFMVAARVGASTVFDRAYVSLSLIISGLFITLLVTNWVLIA